MKKKLSYIVVSAAGLGLIIFLYRLRSPSENKEQTPTPTPQETKIETVEYVNNDYGFRLSLPNTWKGYAVVTEKWDAQSLETPKKADIEGVEILIRHPQWTEANPRQDIPVMVVTVDQWQQILDGKYHIGAAPINPTELDKNSRYVFALPARYNYSFLPGYEEVANIIERGNLKAF